MRPFVGLREGLLDKDFNRFQVYGLDFSGPRNQGRRGVSRHPADPFVVFANKLLTAESTVRPYGREEVQE